MRRTMAALLAAGIGLAGCIEIRTEPDPVELCMEAYEPQIHDPDSVKVDEDRVVIRDTGEPLYDKSIVVPFRAKNLMGAYAHAYAQCKWQSGTDNVEPRWLEEHIKSLAR